MACYSVMLMVFVLTLKKGYYKYQVGQLAWTIAIIVVTVVQVAGPPLLSLHAGSRRPGGWEDAKFRCTRPALREAQCTKFERAEACPHKNCPPPGCDVLSPGRRREASASAALRPSRPPWESLPHPRAQANSFTQNIFNGLFWFLYPVGLVICNDSMAYFCGLAMGVRRTLSLQTSHTIVVEPAAASKRPPDCVALAESHGPWIPPPGP